MYRILVAADLSPESIDLLNQAQDIRYEIIPPHLDNLRSHLKEAHALICRENVQVDADLLSYAPELKIIAHVSTGWSGIDLDTATARGILVMTTPGESAIAAAELTITLMLALGRRLVEMHNGVRDGWWLLDRARGAGTQVNGKTLGIIGLGRVGKIVARVALALNMQVLAYDPYIEEEMVLDRRIHLIGFNELLKVSDYISTHLPHIPEIEGLINAESIALMKKGVRIINTSHGSVIDEAALFEALKTGHVAGAALDVFREEPPYNSPLVGMEQVIHTPHIGDNTVENQAGLSLRVVEQVLDALRDVDYRNVVNMPLMPGVSFEQIRPYIHLANCMGAVHHALSRHPIQKIAMETIGEEMNRLLKPMMVGLIKGILEQQMETKVSFVNAPVIAQQRGWQVTQGKGLIPDGYSNAVTVQVTLDGGETITITGSLLDRKEPHIVRINQYQMNFVPKGDLLLMGSFDKPGVIGKIGSLLADNKVNIASWHTGRAEPGGYTLTVLTLDEPIPQEAMDAVLELDFVRHARGLHIS